MYIQEGENMAFGRKVIRLQLRYTGWVQGVGFRYRATYAARRMDCTGWVENEPDGSVSMEIQGTREAIDQVILAIERGTYVRIENMRCHEIPVESGESGFGVRGD